ncbi:MAG: 3-oxoacyl-ACP synthase [Sphingomonadaceae bacterium]|nr:3-oxoacyl-ACP synthase [Sphingomonadaceae bacterium]
MEQAWRSTRPLSVLGTAHALPGAPVGSLDLIDHMERRFGFRRGSRARAAAQRLGVRSRHFVRRFAEADEPATPTNAALAATSVEGACAAAGVRPQDLAYLIAHTTTPDSLLPAGVAAVADRIGFDGPQVELRQACTGFANALMVATGLFAAGCDRPIAIVGSETGSLHLDPTTLDSDESQIVNLMQMGDGAGAVVLGPGGRTAAIEASWFACTGRQRSPGIALAPGARHFTHDAVAVLRSGPGLFAAGAEIAASLGYDVAAVDWVVPHQASGRIAAPLAAHLGCAVDRIAVTADTLGNTGSAAIWMALDRLRRNGIAVGQTALALGAEASKFMVGGFAYRHG